MIDAIVLHYDIANSDLDSKLKKKKNSAIDIRPTETHGNVKSSWSKRCKNVVTTKGDATKK